MEPSVASNCPATLRPCSELNILLLDGDTHFRSALAENLRDDGHEVHGYTEPGGLPSLETLKDFAVVITEYEMTGEDGLSFAHRFHAAHPNIPIIVLTAYWPRHLETQIKAQDFLSFVRKPLRYDEIHDLLHRLTARALG